VLPISLAAQFKTNTESSKVNAKVAGSNHKQSMNVLSIITINPTHRAFNIRLVTYAGKLMAYEVIPKLGKENGHFTIWEHHCHQRYTLNSLELNEHGLTAYN